MRPIVVTGTDTGIGKTVFAAALVHALQASYWKPVQSGLDGDETDTATVARLAGLPTERLLPERYVLSEPLSPHRAAELDGVTIDVAKLALPREAERTRPLVIEGAGGVLVPITRDVLQIELFSRWQARAVVCARTRLGTINHTLLTIEALRRAGVCILGVAFIGDPVPDSEDTICAFAGVKRLGRLPWITPLTGPGLHDAFAGTFRREDFS
jgi:dethiobiotin synthetase